MGKTKTAFIEAVDEDSKKPSYDKAAKEAKRAAKAQAAKKTPESGEKVHLAGLKGGQRIKMVEAEEVAVETAPESSGVKKTQAIKAKVRSPRYISSKNQVDKTKTYPLPAAVKLTKNTSYSRFDATVELHLVIKKTGSSFNVNLPHSAGKSKKVEVADEATLKKLAANTIDFDVLLATPEMMPKLIPFAKLLGPKGLMPNPKNGTLIKNPQEAKNYSPDALILKTEKDAPLIHTVVGKVSQADSELVENATAIINAVGKNQLLKAYLKATMGPSVKVQV